jgi:hypothetical protein
LPAAAVAIITVTVAAVAFIAQLLLLWLSLP